MPYVEKRAVTPLACAFATCGGAYGPLFPVAKLLVKNGGGELLKSLGQDWAKVAADSITKLSAVAISGKVTPVSVLHRYGLPDHFRDMNAEAQLGQDSVAREIPPDIRAVAHTLLPLRNGFYANQGRLISFKGLVPLGPQTGNLVVHLGGIFSSGCTDEEIKALLTAQAEDGEFLKVVERVGTLDYDGTQLQRATKVAKEQLGL